MLHLHHNYCGAYMGAYDGEPRGTMESQAMTFPDGTHPKVGDPIQCPSCRRYLGPHHIQFERVLLLPYHPRQ